MVSPSGPATVELPLFLIACRTISGEKRYVELCGGHFIKGLVKSVAISRFRVRVLEEKVMG